jgi:hypothetical protein
MRHVKLLNGLLWVANVAIGAAIVVYAFQYLLFPETDNLLKNVEMDSNEKTKPPKQAMNDYTALKTLPNPVTPKSPTGTPQPGENFPAKLLGAHPGVDEGGAAVAFLVVTTTNQGVNAYQGEPITYRGELVNELRGWTLLRLTETGADFTNGSKTVSLRRDEAAVAAMPAGPVGKPFDIGQSKSKRLNMTDSTDSWTLDRAEITWAIENAEQLLSGVELSAYPNGGVKIDSAGPIAGQRGFMDGDIVKSVNGRRISDRSDLINLANDPAMKNAMALTILVERAGRPFTLDFRPGPK